MITESDLKFILKTFEMVNPILISDGYGEFPDTYIMDESDAEKLARLIIKKGGV